jgi:hypothetical protein
MKPVWWIVLVAGPLLAIVVATGIILHNQPVPKVEVTPTAKAQVSRPTAPIVQVPPVKAEPLVAMEPPALRERSKLTTGFSVMDFEQQFGPILGVPTVDRNVYGEPFRVYYISEVVKGMCLLTGEAYAVREASFGVLFPLGDLEQMRRAIGFLVLACELAEPSWEGAADWVKLSTKQDIQDFVDGKVATVETNPQTIFGRHRFMLIGLPTKDGPLLTVIVTHKDEP